MNERAAATDDRRPSRHRWSFATLLLLLGVLVVIPERVRAMPTEAVFGNSTYLVGTPGLTWTQAHAEAEAAGGRLLEINSRAENDFIVRTFWDNSPIWLGLTNIAGSVSNTVGIRPTYTNWMPNQPSGQRYARIAQAEGQWDDGANTSTGISTNGGWSPTGTTTTIIEITTWSFISIPDLFNADYADLSGGADPGIAAVFGAGYANGLVAAPNWVPGGPNSMNPEFAAVLHRSVDDMVLSAGGAPELVMIAGDLVGGRWPQNSGALQSVFGGTDVPLTAALENAAASYYSWIRTLFSESGVDTVLAAIGDHDIGDNPWPVNSTKSSNVNVMKQAFGRYMVDPVFEDLNNRRQDRVLNSHWTDIRFGPGDANPSSLRQYDEGSFIYQEQNVLFVTVDVFRYEGADRQLDRAGGAVSAAMTAEHLDWVRDVLERAESEPSVDHVIVQGHTPVLGPVNRNRSSGLLMRGGENSPFWQAIAKHGTSRGGKVRAFFAGEVHATTSILDPASGIVQISHGALVQAIKQNFDNSDPTYLVADVSRSGVEITEYTIDLDRRGDTSSVWEVDRAISTTHDTYVSGPTATGTMSIDVSGGDLDLTSSGSLAVARAVSSNAPAADQLIGLSGSVSVTQNNSSQWHSITFEQPLDDPIVIMGPPTSNGSAPAFARVRHVSPTGFEFQIDEWQYLDGFHLAESVSWLAVERGVHEFTSGKRLDANSVTADTIRATREFDAQFADPPVVFAQVASSNGSDAVIPRLDRITTTRFDFFMQEEESSFLGPINAAVNSSGIASYGPFNALYSSRDLREFGAHTTETLHYLALSPSTYDRMIAGRIDVTNSDEPFEIVHGAQNFNARGFLAQVQNATGLNPATPRVVSVGPSLASIFVQEETSHDPEVDRGVNDIVAWMTMPDRVMILGDGSFLDGY